MLPIQKRTLRIELQSSVVSSLLSSKDPKLRRTSSSQTLISLNIATTESTDRRP